ncbi:vWA domain-containing protein [Novipirellula artificiosorum]|nr:vWA domain-containing protein [Novipirellula artificiosorum]
MTLILIWYWRRSPDHDVPLIVAAVTQSAPRLPSDPLPVPPNPFAKEDAEYLQAWFNRDARQHVEFLSTVENQTGSMERAGNDSECRLLTAITDPLTTAIAGGPGGDMIVLFVTAQGIVHQDQPYLLVGDSEPTSPSTWVSVEELLQSVQQALETRRETHATEKTRVVLFLDGTRGGPIWDWGKLDDSFTEAVGKVVDRESKNRIAVIVSSSEGERSWCDPRRGRSLFAKAIIASLTGSASTGNDRYITVGEIADDVRRQVSTDAQAIWDANQHPKLLSEHAASWRLIQKPEPVPSPVLPDVDVDQLKNVFEQVDRLWDRHNEIAKRTHPPLVTNPLAWGVLEKQLARLDQLALAGQAYESDRDRVIANCEKLLRELSNGSSRIPKQEALPELQLVDYFGCEPASERLGATQERANQAIKEFTAAWEKEPVPEKIQLAAEIDEQQLTEILWPWLIKKQFESNALTAAAGMLDRVTVESNKPSRLVETYLIRLLSAPDLPQVGGIRANAIVESHRASRGALLTKDLRASFWIRQATTTLDFQRMRFTDAALGHGESGGAETQLSLLTTADYRKIHARGDMVSEAYQLRDQMLHEVPRIAETLLWDVGAFGQQEASRVSAKLIQDAIDKVRCLAARLRLKDAVNHLGMIDDRSFAQINDARMAADVAMDRLSLRLKERVDEIRGTKASDERGLRQAVALLQGSGVRDALQRAGIHQRLVEMIGNNQLDLTATESPESPTRIPESNGPWQQQLQESVRIENQHAWVHWLDQTQDLTCPEAAPTPTDKEETPASSASLSSEGVLLRNKIVELGNQDFGNVSGRPEELSSSGERLASVRQDIDDQETQLRCQTVILSDRPKSMQRAIEQRFELDLQLFVMEQAARTLRERWCEAREGEEPFFVQATDRLLGIKAFKPLPPILDGSDLQQRLADANQAATENATLNASPTERSEQRPLLRQVSGKAVTFQLPAPRILPPGDVSVWTNQDSERLSLDEAANESLTTSFTVSDDISSVDDTFVVESFFRGLRRRGGLTFRRIRDPQTVLFELPHYGPPTAFVQAAQQDAEKIVLVFDCSGSMDINKLDAARGAVKQFLKSLPAKTRVGMVLFGHRYGWVQTVGADGKKDIMVRDEVDPKRYQAYTIRGGQKVRLASIRVDDRSASHNPNFDVEAKVDLAPLEDARLQLLVSELDNLSAVGVTPTYQAINKAYGMLGLGDGRIIVVTDGVPFCVGVETASFRDQAVANRASYPNVNLHIVNFANTNPQADLNLAFPNCVVKAKDGDELIDKLQNLRFRPQSVWKRDGRIQSEEVELGSTMVLDQWPPPRQGNLKGQPVRPALPYEIEAQTSETETASTEVRVEGGEAFVLQLRGGRLAHVPFPRRLNVFRELEVDGSDSNRYSVIALPPDVNNNRKLTLKLVIENTSSESFTPRPSDVWIDLVGVDAERRRTISYSINQQEFEVSRGVPVLVCRVDDWPDWANNVHIEAWLRFGDPEASREPLPLRSESSVALDSVPGVSFRVERQREPKLQLSITETYAADSPVKSVRLLSQPLPNRQTTRVYPKEGVVEEVLEYDRPPENLEVFVTKRGEITDSAPVHARGSISISGR